jgi:hypothetical protein
MAIQIEVIPLQSPRFVIPITAFSPFFVILVTAGVCSAVID